MSRHITVFLMGGNRRLEGGSAWGGANRQANAVWVVADPIYGRTATDLPRTIAHEIGHILVGYGHPDQNDGPAPLPGTRHIERLMHSGDGLPGLVIDGLMERSLRGHRLVKGEWDAAEKWLGQNIPN